MAHKVQMAFVSIALLICAGCTSDGGIETLSDYQSRLHNVLDFADIDETWTFPSDLKFPKQTAASEDAYKASISVLDFLSLYGCSLQQVIGEKNSNLGKFAAASVNLANSVSFITEAPACIEELTEEGKDELAQTLNTAAEMKQKALPSEAWLAIIAGEEAKLFWDIRIPADYPFNTSIEVVQSVRRLDKWLQQLKEDKAKADFEDLERQLSILRTGDGGALIASMGRYAHQLDQSTLLMKEALAAGSFCANGRPVFNAQAFDNVVQKFFVGQVQPWVSAISTRYYELMPAVTEMESQLSEVETSSYSSWKNRRDSFLVKALDASRRHVEQIKKVQDACQPK